jgi:hypothetical protein
MVIATQAAGFATIRTSIKTAASHRRPDMPSAHLAKGLNAPPHT